MRIDESSIRPYRYLSNPRFWMTGLFDGMPGDIAYHRSKWLLLDALGPFLLSISSLIGFSFSLHSKLLWPASFCFLQGCVAIAIILKRTWNKTQMQIKASVYSRLIHSWFGPEAICTPYAHLPEKIVAVGASSPA